MTVSADLFPDAGSGSSDFLPGETMSLLVAAPGRETGQPLEEGLELRLPDLKVGQGCMESADYN